MAFARRRGASAIEFALTLPLLVVFLAGIADYGWYFFQEGFVSNALREATRSGSFQMPASDDAEGACTPCQTTTAALAVAELSELGIAVSTEDVTPSIANIANTCALVLEPDLPYDSLIGLVPTPSRYRVRIVAFAQNVTGC